MPNHTLHAHSISIAEFKHLRREFTRLNARLETLARKINRNGKPAARRRFSSTQSPLDFQQRIRVTSRSPATKSIRGKFGTVLGRAPERDRWIYTVWIDGQDQCWSLSHDQLKPTAQAPANRPAEAQHVRVKVDARGRGSIAQ